MVKVLGKSAFVSMVIAVAIPSIAADEVVLSTRDFTVTTQDFEYYLDAQGIIDDRRERALSKEGAVKEVFENIYVIRAFAAEGEHNPAIDQDEIRWMVQSYRERLLMNRQLEIEVKAKMDGINWDDLAEEDYKANKTNYREEEQVSAAHILISVDNRTDAEAQTRAREVLARLEAGEDFAALAKEYSDDPESGRNGGELGFFPRKNTVKPFEDAVFAMTKPGEIAGPVKTGFGYHIIRFNKRKPARQLSFAEAKAEIIPQLKQRTAQSLRQSKIDAVKSGEVDLGLVVDLPLLEQIEQRYKGAVETGPTKQ